MGLGDGYVYSEITNLYVTIGGAVFPVAGFIGNWAINEIPTAQCFLAAGRNVTSLEISPLNSANLDYTQMMPATVTFTPSGGYRSDGTQWPAGPQVIFRGYFTGFSYRKFMGKFVVVANLIHWLADLACSSALGKNLHAANPTQLNTAAVANVGAATGAGQGSNISSLTASQINAATILQDVWAAIKTAFCTLANLPTSPIAPNSACGGDGTFSINNRALMALQLIEGNPIAAANVASCAFVPVDGPTTYYAPLALIGAGGQIIQNCLANAIGGEMVSAYASVSFWDKMVMQFCPMFGMGIVPMIERAVVIADTPAYNANLWKLIPPEEIDSYDFNASLERPLRGVGVAAMYTSQTQGGINALSEAMPVVGGCYVESAVSAGDGLIQVIEPPAWLLQANTAGAYVGYTTGILPQVPGRAVGGAANPPLGPNPGPETFNATLQAYYEAYAQTVYVNSMLRGRMGAFSGKLRFDIAPGSILQISPQPEFVINQFADDTAAEPLYGCVSRVTININAEAATAGTSFQLTHVRTAYENSQPRTSVAAHPLFGTAIFGGGKHGAPLLPVYDL